MAGLRQLRNKYYARTLLWDGFRQKETLIPLLTTSKTEARIRLEEVNRNESDIKNGIKISFAWQNEKGITKTLYITLEEALSDYLRFKKRLGLSPGSINRIKNSMDTFTLLFGRSIAVKSINNSSIEKFTDYCLDHYTPVGTNINLRNLKTFLKWLFETELLEKHLKVRMVKVEKSKPSYLTEKQFNALMDIDELDHLYKRMFKFYIGTGCRLTEPFYGRNIGDYLVIPAEFTKAKIEKEVFVSEDLKTTWQEMMDYKNEWIQNGYNFKNLPLKISKTFLWACREVNIEHHFHDLRHTFAVVRYLLTNDIYAVKKDLGHASVTTTEMYANFKRSRLLEDFPSLKKLIEKQQNIAKIPIMDTDSMDTEGIFLTE